MSEFGVHRARSPFYDTAISTKCWWQANMRLLSFRSSFFWPDNAVSTTTTTMRKTEKKIIPKNYVTTRDNQLRKKAKKIRSTKVRQMVLKFGINSSLPFYCCPSLFVCLLNRIAIGCLNWTRVATFAFWVWFKKPSFAFCQTLSVATYYCSRGILGPFRTPNI